MAKQDNMIKIKIVPKRKVLEDRKDGSENDRQRKSRLFSGYEEMKKLSIGITEDEDDEEELEEKKKPKKKNCSKGNTWHKKSDGKLTNKANAGSYSLQFKSKGKSNCKGGVARVTPSGQERFVSIPCGRANADGGKAPNKCGTKKIKESFVDYTNCKIDDLDKKYKKDKKTKQTQVEIEKKLTCDYKPLDINPKVIARLKKLADINRKYDDKEMIKVDKSVFERFMDWVDTQDANVSNNL